MPLILHVGLSKKVGLPHYSSLGASCHVQVELDSTLLQNDLDVFHCHVHDAFTACSQAVSDELARQNVSGAQPEHTIANYAGEHPARNNGDHDSFSPHSQTGPDLNHPVRPTSGQGRDKTIGFVRLATPSQVRAIFAIAHQHGLELADIMRGRFGAERPEDLSIGDASALIDELKAAANGTGGER